MPSPRCARPSTGRAPTAAGWPRSSTALEEALLLGRCTQGVVALELRLDPTAKPFGLQHRAVGRIVEIHIRERRRELPLELGIEIGPGREHAVIIGRRGPDLRQGTLGYQP